MRTGVVSRLGAQPAPGYRLTTKLGLGGFGEVWEATRADGRVVALKFLPCSEEFDSTLANEIRQLLHFRELHHPNLIKLHNVMAGSDYIIISMERADGNLHDLRQVYEEESGAYIPPGFLCNLFEQAAEVLDFVAGERPFGSGFTTGCLQHCDVKPKNMLLLGDTLKLADLGLCTLRQPHNNRRFMGTPPYAAPEFYQGRISARSDQYALAVSYCELRGGWTPFFVKNPFTNEHQLMPPDLNMIPKPERPVVARALDVSWINRWPSCAAFIEALGKVVTDEPCAVTDMPCGSRSPYLPGTVSYAAKY